jgi:hypothetical protein
MKLAFENKLNILLSGLLQMLGIISRSEYLDKGRRDIIIYHQGIAIVLEGSYSREDSERDARKRIKQMDADIAMAIHYPPIFPQDLPDKELKKLLSVAKYKVKIIIPDYMSPEIMTDLIQDRRLYKFSEEWIEVDLNELATIINEVTQFIINEPGIIKAESQVIKLVNDFVEFLSAYPNSSIIADNLYEILYKLYGFSIGEPSKIKESIFAQSVLAIFLSAVYYESIRIAYGLESIKDMAQKVSPQNALAKAIDDILKINYEPIFMSTRQMLSSFPNMPRHFHKMINLSSEIASKRALLRRDFAGKIYHKIVGEWSLRKGLATFYTEIPSAYLLLYLADPSLCRIADLACGSGTLLVAAYSATNSNYRLGLMKRGIEKDPIEIEKEFHIKFIKKCFGFDVLEYAAQITTLNLALHSPETPIKRMSCIYALPLGFREEDKFVSLGSLEFARKERRIFQIFATKYAPSEKKKVLLSKLLRIKPFDMIVMNPPFTRATGRRGREGAGLFGFIPSQELRKIIINDFNILRDDIREILNKEAKVPLLFKKLFDKRDFKAYLSIGPAGEGLLFLCLAHIMLNERGKMCFVLPRSLLSGVSWFLARSLLISNYHIEYVVVSYDPIGGYNFSESTNLSECLIIAKKLKDYQDRNNKLTRFIILLTKPKTSIEAIGIANEIKDKIEKNEVYVQSGKSKAFFVSASYNEMINSLDNWGRFIFLPNPSIIEVTKQLFNGFLRLNDRAEKINLIRLTEMIDSIGIDRHHFIDNFKIINDEVPGCVKVFYGGEEAQRSRMLVEPECFALAKNDKAKNIFKKYAGKLLLPDRIWVATAHVTAVLSTNPTLSNIFYAIRLKNENEDRLKSICLWFNTTWGLLTILASREETRGGWISLKMSQWRLLPVLDINLISDDKLKKLSLIFDQFENVTLGRIPLQYDTNRDLIKHRLDLDFLFLKAMDINVTKDSLIAFYKDIFSSFRQWLQQ